MPATVLRTGLSSASTAFRIVGWLVLLTATIALAVRQYQLVDHYALNIMFSDQWDLYRPILYHRSWWALFTFQHGPHRQGVGFLIMPLLAKLSGCNTRWDAFATSYTMMTASVVGLFLSYLCGVRQPLALLAVPLMYLTVREYESFTAASNLSHGAMPMLIFTTICAAWFIRDHTIRIATTSLLTFGAIFTGFGIFAGVLVPVVFTIEAIQAHRQKQSNHAMIAICGIAACAVSWSIFSIGYVFEPANPTFHFPYDKPLEYVGFVAIMLSNFYGAANRNPLAVPIGLMLTASLVAICIYHFRQMLRYGTLNRRTSVILFLLSVYALIYCFNTAIGRVSMGWKSTPLSSRYVILMIPAGMAIYLQLATVKRRLYALALPVFYCLLIAPGALQLTAVDRRIIHVLHHDRRIAWANAYLATHDEMEANRLSNFAVYPLPGHIQDELDILEANHLNFFRYATTQPVKNPAH
jgi:hypothetical protein